ncbi:MULTISPECIES: efflux RND transporter periplasmic adaptor subunit [unclassified Rhizobium]|uniref:efflux RND transporter periplasmic adaptor subunit n=1 Tax=unclassified Rhizobium TaxID=2613769 RepID=UPI001ADA7549|nr:MULTISPECIES: efflux RND transporter periplasmic adaptor subunit [unclassified Rhizobium]MBO9126652.1 efflux RND transporter periplasmic adaptor subunit [Rhizobium sp. 16-488-2b]MBO9177099.1 efflux RND transporter periplasmic adaptor subunit [Rhizobium sp. 16-488-2a]
MSLFQNTISSVCGRGLILLSIVMPLAACNDQPPQAPAVKSVTVIQPQSADVTRYLYETGTAKALDSVALTARVSGYLKSIDYKDGTEVKAGQRLFLIEPDQYEAQLQQAQATVEQTQASFNNAQVQLDRQEQLSQSSTTTQANVDNARASRDEAKAQLDQAKASLREAQINLGYTSVTAPFDGFVTEHQADVGALVGSGSPTTLATIVRLDPIHVSFAISDTDMLRIRKQARASGLTAKDVETIAVEAATKADDGFPHKGKLDYIAPQTDAETGTLSVRAVFENNNRDLVPNLFLRLRIPLGVVNGALLVPPSAIGTDQQGRYVLVVNGDDVVERRAVNPLDRSDDMQQIQGSLAATDWVITNAASGVRPGDKVQKKDASTPVQAEAKQPAASQPAAN